MDALLRRCPLPDAVKSLPHVAFKADDLARALEGKEILIAPNSPSPGERLAPERDVGLQVDAQRANRCLEIRGLSINAMATIRSRG
jgi:hypothetical protein